MPALASYAGRDVALGVRPEDFTDAAYADPAQPRLRADVTLVEALGPERLVYLTIDASPVVTTELLEIARDTDASTLEALAHESDVKKASLVARYDARSDVRVGTPVQVAVNASRLHFFDLDDGRTIR
jgi:multiple sugar transport system ATP-binding protein